MTRKFRRCEVDLTDPEVRTKARRIAVVNAELNEALKAKAAVSEKVKELMDARALLIDQVASGKEWRDVEVEEHVNMGRRTVEIVRVDTGERVDERPVTEADQQGRLGFDDMDGTVHAEPDELEGLSAADLRRRAKELGVKVPAKAKATEILAIIRSAQPSSDGEVELLEDDRGSLDEAF